MQKARAIIGLLVHGDYLRELVLDLPINTKFKNSQVNFDGSSFYR